MIDFPNSPSDNDTFIDGNGDVWAYRVNKWRRQGNQGLMIVSETPPASPSVGMRWYRSSDGVTATWVEDGTSGQWVSTELELNPPSQPVLQFFATPETQIANAMTNVFAHGLGGVPTNFKSFLVCQNTADGYTAGDIIEISARFGTGAETVNASVDATNITMIGGSGVQIQLARKDTGATFTVASGNTNWFMKIHAWLETI